MSNTEEDFLQDLEGDLGSFIGDESEEDELSKLRSYIDHYQPVKLSNYQNLDIQDVTSFPKFEPSINELISRPNDEDLAQTLTILNSLTYIAQNEITVLHNLLKLIYGVKFGELESLVPQPQQFADVIRIIETNEGNFETDAQLSKEQVLVLNMSMKSSFQAHVNVDKDKVLQLRDLLMTVSRIRNEINSFILSKASLVAPNLCLLIGPEVTSLLLSHSGGVLELSQVPSCNLASIGKNKHLSHELHTNLTGVRQEGYIYRSSLVQEQPLEFRKQMLRMVCAKVALAARVDAGHPQDGQLGLHWKNELLEKIQKLREPPPGISTTKPLPVPEDQPKKKRAGRKFRKYKQQFQLSQLRQLQNRMEFGKAEQSVTDDAGEELGLGMAKSLRNVPVTQGNSAKMSKAMKRRMDQVNEQAKTFMLDLGEQPSEKDNENNDWFKHHMGDK
ncbi:ZYRO0C12386p [Zygosaccharomyces rouxii]|uniref:ZYRO0C12386p n=1 Tax=Zygosaccharomyces rouxii (strain ATCC 2623 / CBS 732 / NBRC 1130 / NCYC 568 / NRRL Y-229) TaxID=559307 RepID=C5DTY8_ZYGRC|nr:uncharacterized protein ZYRO0C12386g [Zygosaccharomyces rouxii]KAH9201575.1 hypothetical protein LQ764DRAFT_184938 [Zygosaccharomyces rouxii]CAR27249.1 ZYRO0C12386p [Zygosaccharomyces rouxii]